MGVDFLETGTQYFSTISIVFSSPCLNGSKFHTSPELCALSDSVPGNLNIMISPSVFYKGFAQKTIIIDSFFCAGAENQVLYSSQ